MSHAARLAALAMTLGLVAGCTTSDPARTAAAEAVNADNALGKVPAYCPQVSLREGTAILRKGEGEELQYIASITTTTRSCRVRDGQLYMEVGIAGRVVPGPAAKTGGATLPIRVAITDSGKVVYSNLGQQQVSVSHNSGPQNFTYVDRDVRLPEPQAKTLTIYAGFDEGAPAKTAAR